ncbi:PEP-CTERM sorting domain-containing protein [Nitrosospira multiformis]|uniref:PEP-CTERM protein-sorting domain-containing protein n=1 Tax=Nitrosospira multiformis TaxID=1231 RepID=A0A1I7FCZ8_9PROT|nr:PEP-CTERM sorting domain-containing protein [Nitrosospira multiformis]SFU34133.1 PEP-CTERM protein-sorting domain-containing protein [Nitrosospira multiformis]
MSTKLLRWLSSLAIIATSLTFTVPAAAYTFWDDPSSAWGGDLLTADHTSGNVYTVENLLVQNTTANSLPELNFTIPFAWQLVGETYLPMEWRNDLNGWYTSNFNNTGTSLTVKLTSPVANTVAMGELADLTGSQQLPLTEPCFSGSPSCQSGIGQPPETRNTTDLIPVFSLGSFAPNEAKRFDVSFTYTFGDNRAGTEGATTSFFGYTVSPIPEPETYAMFLAGLGIMAVMAHRRKV